MFQKLPHLSRFRGDRLDVPLCKDEHPRRSRLNTRNQLGLSTPSQPETIFRARHAREARDIMFRLIICRTCTVSSQGNLGAMIISSRLAQHIRAPKREEREYGLSCHLARVGLSEEQLPDSSVRDDHLFQTAKT